MMLVDRLAKALEAAKPQSQRMFSGVGFMLRGNLAIGTTKQGLIVRVGADNEKRATALPGATVMVMRGRKMPGWIIVAQAGCRSDSQLHNWVEMALAFNKILPAKSSKAAAARSKKK